MVRMFSIARVSDDRRDAVIDDVAMSAHFPSIFVTWLMVAGNAYFTAPLTPLPQISARVVLNLNGMNL